MATENFTGDGHQKAVNQLLCSSNLAAGLQGQLTLLSVLNSFLSVAAFVGNALILIALRKESSLHPPSKLLLRCLATADLCVGLVTQPFVVTSWLSAVNAQWKICRFASAAGFTTAYIFCGVSVLTLTAISVDRLLSLLLGLRYRQVVTLKRTYVILIAFWVMSTVISVMQFWNQLITLRFGTIASSLCLVTAIFSYTKIFFTLRHHQNQVQHLVQQGKQSNQLNMARYKKAVSIAIWLQLAMIVCYLPYGVVTALAPDSGQISSVYYTWRYASVTVFFLNSSLNPLLYCWKIGEVRQAVKDTIRQVFCHCFSTWLLKT